VSADSALVVNAELAIPRHELVFRASRSGGPGGQHVNTSSTRIELLWNVESARSLGDDTRARLRAKLGGRIDAQGNLRIVASAYRSQARNRDDAEQRLVALVRQALVVPKARKRTRPSRAAKEKRLESKKKQSSKKRDRRSDHHTL
jgi:ribosome-associated protein